MKLLVKQALLIAIGSLITAPVFSQTTKAPVKKTSAPALSADQSKMLCKAWQLDTVSVYGVDKKAKGKEANDAITPMADGTLFITHEGEAATGTWTYAGGRINTVTKSPDQKLSFKMTGLADNRLVLEYQYPAPDLSRVTYIYSPKK